MTTHTPKVFPQADTLKGALALAVERLRLNANNLRNGGQPIEGGLSQAVAAKLEIQLRALPYEPGERVALRGNDCIAGYQFYPKGYGSPPQLNGTDDIEVTVTDAWEDEECGWRYKAKSAEGTLVTFGEFTEPAPSLLL